MTDGLPRVAILLGAAWPGNDASGPVQSVREIAARFAREVHCEVFARTGPPGEKPLARHGERHATPWGGITYLDVSVTGARNLGSRLQAARCDRMWLNSVWDREFSLPALAYRRFGAGIPRQTLLSTRGEFSAGALALHALRKRAMRHVLGKGGFLRDVTLHATNPAEAADVARAFPDHRIIIASNLRVLPQNGEVQRSRGPVLELLFLGRISPVKGLHNALAAVRRLTIPARLTICGPIHDEAYWAGCQHQLADIPSHVTVNFVGPVDNREAMRRYAEADLFLNPSASENFGHTIFEALASGTPVLTGIETPWGALEADRAGFNVPSNDAGGIASAIERFARLDATERTAWQRAARDRASRQINDPATVHIWHAWLTSGLSPPLTAIRREE